MKHEQELRIQALLDGELSPRESQQVSGWLGRDPEAQGLYDALRATRTLVSSNEPPRLLPETREFYWSRLERQLIEAARTTSEPAPARAGSWWVRIFAPVAAGAGVLALALTLGLPLLNRETLSTAQEIESPLEEVRTFSFHAHDAGMTVVWVEHRVNW